MSQSSLETRVESRIPPIAAVLVMLLLVTSLPSRYQLIGSWFPYVAGAFVIGAMLAVAFTPGNRFYATAERWILFFFSGLAIVVNGAALAQLAADMVTRRHDFASVTLLESSIEIWFGNIIVFSLIYWQLDSGGPQNRVAAVGIPDFHFKEADHWGPRPITGKPSFLDYLFLSFTVATSFTAAEPRPLTGRAQLLMMLETLISLTTLFVVAARAIATLS
ncbi:MAG: hypothetical protein JO219_12650 [Candidatus Eremiobacteraeota bacterium]|nr:hypothetical protein [Candidatus Eremiobacteraeota bacterium]MBV8366085.1 hypothetical protein [Candidatus Eremiobacteraeota bacterium]